MLKTTKDGKISKLRTDNEERHKYFSKYYKERYHNDPEFRRKHLERVSRYEKTERGKRLRRERINAKATKVNA